MAKRATKEIPRIDHGRRNLLLHLSRHVHYAPTPIKKFVRTAGHDRTIKIQAGQHTVTAADPLPQDLKRWQTPRGPRQSQTTSPREREKLALAHWA